MNLFFLPKGRFALLLALSGVLELSLLLLLHLRSVSPPPLPPPLILRLSLAPAPPKSPVRTPSSRPGRPMKRKSVIRPISPRVVATPQGARTPTPPSSLLASSSGRPVSLGWGSGKPEGSARSSTYTPPRLLTRVDTSRLYTEKMKSAEEEGDVVVDLWIDPSGHLSRYQLVLPSVYDDINRAALALLGSLKFTPAKEKGYPVPGRFELSFRFRLRRG